MVNKINHVDYTDDNICTWNVVFNRLKPLHYMYASKEHVTNLKELEEHQIICEDEIPNFEKISKYLAKKTGFKLVNVGGMIEPRAFLYGLSFGIFYSTQYIRHKSVPFYSPEPDIIHEVMGHVPMLANKQFADFSKRIGKKALGASDAVIDMLCKVYFYSVEFGILGNKVIGAGILGSCEELELVGSGNGKVQPWNLEKILNQPLTLSEYQPQYADILSLANLDKILDDLEMHFSA